MNVAICDKDGAEAKAYAIGLEENFKNTGCTVCFYYFKECQFLKYEVEEKICFDLYILVAQEQKEEMKLVETIRKRDSKACIIIVVDNVNAAEDFEIKPFRVLIRDEIDSMLPGAVEEAITEIKKREQHCYTVKNQSGTCRVLYNDIQYITHEGKYSILSVKGERKIRVRKTLKQIFEELRHNEFIWVDRGCICNLAHIKSIQNGIIIMRNGEQFCITRGKIRYFKGILQNYWKLK